MQKRFLLILFLIISPSSLFSAAETTLDQQEHPKINFLYSAVGKHNYNAVEALLKSGVPANGYSRNYPPFFYAIIKASISENPEALRILELFLKNGADPNRLWMCQTKTNSQTPLTCAATSRNGNPKPVILLLKHGAKIDLPDAFGYTPLHIATEWGNNSFIQLLLEYGANPFIKNDNDETPLEHTDQRGWSDDETKKLLQQAETDWNRAKLQLKQERTQRRLLLRKLSKKRSSTDCKKAALPLAPWPTWDEAHSN